MLYRRFGYLQSRILLRRQDELRELETNLCRLDRKTAAKDPVYMMARDKCAAENKNHTALLDEIEEKYKAYGWYSAHYSGARSLILGLAELIITSQSLANLERPQKRDYESVLAHFREEQPLCREEWYIEEQGDIVTLKPGRETTWLDRAVERILEKTRCRITRVGEKRIGWI
jgi:hypothetical protein